VPKDNIVLIGFMTAGKTTVGEILSGLTGMPLVDTDRAIEKGRGGTIREIFATDGEPGFRKLEREIISVEAARSGVILAVGGGAVLDGTNVENLRAGSMVYLLLVTASQVASRVGADASRPLLGADVDEIASLLSSRERAYLDAADVVIETDGRSPGEVAGEIAHDFESRRRES